MFIINLFWDAVLFWQTGCQDIIQKCRDIKPRDCYYGYYATACCKTCSALVQNSSNINCLYGDKGTDCSVLVPEVCHLSTHFCCQTCARYLSPKKTIASGTSAIPPALLLIYHFVQMHVSHMWMVTMNSVITMKISTFLFPLTADATNHFMLFRFL